MIRAYFVYPVKRDINIQCKLSETFAIITFSGSILMRSEFYAVLTEHIYISYNDVKV